MPIPILYVVHSLGHGGTERQVRVLAAGLDRTRFEVHVASVEGGHLVAELLGEKIPVLNLPLRSFWEPGPWNLSGLIADYIRDKGIRLVHAFDPGLSLVSMLAARRSRVKFLTSQRCYMDLIPRKYRWMMGGLHWLADGIVTNSFALRNHLHRDYWQSLKNIHVCHNALDTAAFSRDSRNRLEQVRDASIVIGTVCVLRPEKNLLQLADAFMRVHQVAPAVRLLVMGSGPEEAAFRARLEQNGIASACTLLPGGPDVRPALRSIDVFVNCSASEGLPNAVMEAMGCGCAVVVSNVGGGPELLEAGVHGLLTQPGDTSALAGQLQQLVSNPERVANMGEAGAAHMQRNFSLAASTRTMEAIYNEIIDK